MCVVSMVGDHYRDTLPQQPYWPGVAPAIFTSGAQPEVSKADFDALKRDVKEMKLLLNRALEYDKRTGQPHCETEDKVAFIRKVAEFVGVDIDIKG